MTFDSDMSLHLIGMPSHGLLEPQRPGPTRTYPRPSRRIAALSSASSCAISAVRDGSNASARTYTTSDTPSMAPVPRALSEYIRAPSHDILDQSAVCTLSWSATGRICKTLNMRDEEPVSRLAANSISTWHFISLTPASSRRTRMSASGKVLNFNIGANVMTLYPSASAESTMRCDCMSHVEATWRRLRKPLQAVMSRRSRLMPSSIDVLNFSGLRFSAYIVCCVSRMASFDVDVCNTWLGYLGEKRSTSSPSTTLLPSPKASLTMPSSAFS